MMASWRESQQNVANAPSLEFTRKRQTEPRLWEVQGADARDMGKGFKSLPKTTGSPHETRVHPDAA